MDVRGSVARDVTAATRGLSAPRWRHVCQAVICIGFCIRCCMHPDSTDSQTKGKGWEWQSSPALLQYKHTHSAQGVGVGVCVSVWGGDEAVMERYLEAPPFSEQAVGGSVIPGGERVRGGVCVCVTSHLLLNPISKARGLNQPSPLKACQGRAHK